MRKIDFLAPPDDTGGSNHDPNLELLKELYPGRATLTVKETSTVLGVSDDFIYERLKSGDIKGINTGRNWALPLIEVARLLKDGVK
ncbi:MAG: excisionase family DNA-binding protein [Bacteroidota bacterium]|jgi:excisionase family DNA binding protein